ncbi:NADH-quinone oxidoreductase subunit D-related protein [Acetobacter fallax]|uniref:NADH:ubiquinone oxidoreductase n=1 Tax=Acetobacter fallax TaxID=1737473 RepID=A0ABX0K9J4_9PROT|nr:NADH:ubiquinone oxidoreductase [Acetobacter fallax]NHO33082.1 NADH:ubiquinone oxidoreductase [Acetobacter fallax]NHO36672.1 NADH:ubiquinone oxidoreductase [Acetobacter fallax]
MSGGPIIFGGVPALVSVGKPSVSQIIRAGEKTACRWRFQLDEFTWHSFVEHLADDPAVFVGLWCDGSQIHVLVNDGSSAESGVRPIMASCTLDGPRYPGVSHVRVAAVPFERMIRDLYGVEAMDAVNARPLIDHGMWTSTAPLARRSGPRSFGTDLPEFDPPDEWVAAHGMVFGKGPATGSTEGPVHFRLGVADGVIRTVETRAGYAHRGLIARMRDATITGALELAGRIGAGSAVAHQWAFSAAVENAVGISCPVPATWCRVIFCETERIAMHLLTLARTARAADAELVSSGLYRLREQILRLCGEASGRRLLMDCVCVGGVIVTRHQERGDPIGPLQTVAALGREIVCLSEVRIRELHSLWRVIPGLKHRLQCAGRLTGEQAKKLELQGVAGRACGYGGDFRLHMDAYEDVSFRQAISTGGDVAARCEIMFEEIGESLKILKTLADRISAGEEKGPEDLCAVVPVRPEHSEGYAVIEGPHGPVWHVVTVQNGLVEQCFIADPASTLLMAAEQAILGTSPDNFDLVRCSFGVSIAAADL